MEKEKRYGVSEGEVFAQKEREFAEIIEGNRATDMEIALFLSEHIDKPCEVEVEGEIRNIREFYLKLAEEQLEKISNPFAKKILKRKIEEYKG